MSIKDASEQCCQLALVGPSSRSILEGLGVPTKLLQGKPHVHGLLELNGQPVLVAVSCGLHRPGYTLIADESNAGDLWKSLIAKVSNLTRVRISSTKLKSTAVLSDRCEALQ